MLTVMLLDGLIVDAAGLLPGSGSIDDILWGLEHTRVDAFKS